MMYFIVYVTIVTHYYTIKVDITAHYDLFRTLTCEIRRPRMYRHMYIAI